MYAYVGCRTTKERNARGEGLRVFALDDAENWREVQVVRGLDNPSFLAFDQNHRFLYVVHGDFSEVSSFRISPHDGSLSFLSRQSTGGRNPVHLAVDSTNRFLVVANFATGSLALFPLAEDGSLDERCDLVALPGEPGPHRAEQKGSHPHQILFDPMSRRFLAPDKGVDQIFVGRIDTKRGKIEIDGSLTIVAREGAAPRHGVFHPAKPFVYVANELDSTVSTYGYDAETGRLRPVEIISTLPPDCLVTSHAAGIAITPDGRYVFVSNRGHDSVSTFMVDDTASTLTRVATTSARGRKPRFITLDPSGRRLLVANEDDDSILTFAIESDGQLRVLGNPVSTGSPVCVVFAAQSSTEV